MAAKPGYSGAVRACRYSTSRMADKHGIEVVNETDLARMLESTDARFDQAMLEILRDTRKLCPQVRAGIGAADGQQGAWRGQAVLGMLWLPGGLPIHDARLKPRQAWRSPASSGCRIVPILVHSTYSTASFRSGLMQVKESNSSCVTFSSNGSV